MKIVIINYGAGNIQSIKFAIQRLGYEAVLTDNAEEIKNADKVIFPGVGEASSAMAKLKSTGLDKIIVSESVIVDSDRHKEAITHFDKGKAMSQMKIKLLLSRHNYWRPGGDSGMVSGSTDTALDKKTKNWGN